MAKKKKSAKKHVLFSPKILWSVSAVIVVILISFFTFFRSQNASTSIQEMQSILPSSTPTAIDSTVTPPPFPDFSKQPAQPKNTFDISKWQQFDNPQVGLKFKYPPEWGAPTVTSRKGGISGMSYNISFFPRSNFSVNGESSDFFDQPRDASPDEFKGFTSSERSYGWINPQTYCTEAGEGINYVFCQVTSNKIDMLREQVSFYPYTRLEFLNRPGKEIGGLVFGGEFLSSADNSLALRFQDPRSEYTKVHIKDFNNAIVQRKIGSTSLYTFDEYEKVFETIENY